MKRMVAAVLALMLFLTAFGAYAEGAEQGVSLGEALGMMENEDCPDRILLTDDFSRFAPLNMNGGEIEAYGKALILRREAPLKKFTTLTIAPEGDYIGEDDGETKVYLCVDLMKRLPEENRAASVEEADVVLMAETAYIYAGGVSIAPKNTAPTQGMSYLDAIQLISQFKFYPFYWGIFQISLYDYENGAVSLWQRDVFDPGEVRSWPEMDDMLKQMKEWAAMGEAAKAAGLNGALEYWLNNGGEVAEEDVMTLLEAADVPGACTEKYWALAGEMASTDALRGGEYSALITKRDAAGFEKLAGGAGYGKVSKTAQEIREAKDYLGVVSPDDLTAAMEGWMSLVETVGGSVEVVDGLVKANS